MAYTPDPGLAGNAPHPAPVDADRREDAAGARPVPEPLVARAALPELARVHHLGHSLAGALAGDRVRLRPAPGRAALELGSEGVDPAGVTAGGELLPRIHG